MRGVGALPSGLYCVRSDSSICFHFDVGIWRKTGGQQALDTTKKWSTRSPCRQGLYFWVSSLGCTREVDHLHAPILRCEAPCRKMKGTRGLCLCLERSPRDTRRPPGVFQPSAGMTVRSAWSFVFPSYSWDQNGRKKYQNQTIGK